MAQMFFYPLGALTYALSSRSSIQILDLLFAKVQDVEKHTGWEDALSLALVDLKPAKFVIDICKVIIEKTNPLPPHLCYKILQNGWDAFPPYNSVYDEEKLLEAMALLIEVAAYVDCHAKDGSTLLQRMAGKSLDESCRFLVAYGANVNTHVTQSHGTPLQEAIKYKRVQIAEFFLEHGADVNALPAAKWGVTALQAASTHGMLGMAVRLLERGADVCAPAALEDGRTAIDGAAERGHLEMVQLLLNAYGDHEDLRSVCS